jgi:hypothetical protein
MKNLLVLVLLLAAATLAKARISEAWTYQRLYDSADLVVVGVVTSTIDTSEATVLPYLHPDVHVIGESTEFHVGVVLKGDKSLKSYVLHHYRLANTSGVGLNGPDWFPLILSREATIFYF